MTPTYPGSNSRGLVGRGWSWLDVEALEELGPRGIDISFRYGAFIMIVKTELGFVGDTCLCKNRIFHWHNMYSLETRFLIIAFHFWGVEKKYNLMIKFGWNLLK